MWRIEKAFRMSKHDLQARPIYHRTATPSKPPQRCLRRDGGIALDRAPNRLEH
ncbi:putative transposase domain protein [Mycobacterium avium MAV_120709_2344]|nr:putative transposase domain protein [Mycobacterium avium MAV_120709_2344]